MKTISKALFFGIFIFLVSCTSTQVTSSWKSEKMPATPFKKIMVLGIIQEKDRSLREELENRFVDELKSHGYDAASALQVYGPKAFTKLSEEAIADSLKNSGYDAVLTTVILDKTKDRNYTPGRVSYQPVGMYYNRFGRYYTTIYDRVYTPGYYTTSTNFFFESNFYDIASGDIVYSVQSNLFDPSSAASLSLDYSKAIVKDMVKKGVVVK